MYIINRIEQTLFVQLEMLVYIEALCEKPIFLIERNALAQSFFLENYIILLTL
jgi:hypothetical protein